MPAEDNQESTKFNHSENEAVLKEKLQTPIDTKKSQLSSTRPTKKIAIALFTLAILVGGVSVGVQLVKRQQELREFASSAAECTRSPDCVVFENPGDEGYRELDRNIDHLLITNKPGGEVKFGPASGDNGCYNVEISNNQFRWKRYGTENACKNISNIQVWLKKTTEPTATPTTTEFIKICHYTSDSAHPWQAIEVSKIAWENGHDDAHNFIKTEYDSLYENNNPDCPWPEPGNQGITCADIWCEGGSSPTPTPLTTPTDVPNNVSCICNEVKVYDTSWNLLSENELKQLKSGNIIRFTVSGSTTQGVIEKARFTINGETSQEVTNKKPGTEEFYIQYEIPEGQLNFSINGELYHSTLGWF